MTTYDLERQAVADEYLGGDTDKADAVMESLPYTPDLGWDDVARAIEAVLRAVHGYGGAA
ncbi:MAG TPA: hypothetical protein VKZ55_04440 [Microthrixaceae bacterium]|nr:hypothetical protein [Microthrixaceae bacterium]